MRTSFPLLALLGFVFGAGCQASSIDSSRPLDAISTPAPGSVIQGSATQMSPSLTMPIDPGLRNLIDKAIADLAQRLAVPVTQIKLLEATSVVWSDSSLGCPQPGMRYIQVPEDGLLIRLQAGAQIYEYHSGGFRDPFLCIETDKGPNPPPKIDIFNLTKPNPKSTPGIAPTPDNSIPPSEDQ